MENAGLYSPKPAGSIIFASVPAHSKKGQSAAAVRTAQLFSIKLAADLRRGLPHNLREGYACCTTGFGSPRFSTLESLISFLGQTVAHRPQLSHLE